MNILLENCSLIITLMDWIALIYRTQGIIIDENLESVIYYMSVWADNFISTVIFKLYVDHS